MHFRMILFAISLGSTLSQPLQAAGTVVTMIPDSQWVLNYDTENCSLSRRFVSGDDQIIAQFVSYGPGESFELRLIGKPLEMRSRRKVGVAFGENGTFNERTPNLAKFKSSDMPVLFLGSYDLATLSDDADDSEGASAIVDAPAPELSPDKDRQFDSVTIRMPNGNQFKLQTGLMTSPMAAMGKCVDDLMDSWGITKTELDRVVIRAKPTGNRLWITTQDYPGAMASRGISSRVKLALIVGVDGKVEHCRVQAFTDDATFGEIACKLIIKRANFEPARDADSNPVRSLYRTSVFWQAN